MAKLKNVAEDARDIPAAGVIVEPGDTFEVGDDVFHQFAWPESLYEVVEPPKSKPPASSDDPPARNAKREVWVEYAISRGGDPTAVEDLDRDELINQYGQEN